MSGCTDKRFEQMLYAYELGLLSEADRRELELHLLECRHCNERAVKFEGAAELIRTDSDIRRELETLAKSEPGADDSITPVPSRNWGRIIRNTLAAAAILVILIVQPWRLEFAPSDEAVAAQNRLVITYFEDLSGDAAAGNLGRTITSLLITDLSESHYVQVVSSQRLGDLLRLLKADDTTAVSRETATEVARSAESRWLLQGSIINEDGRTALVSQLVEVSSGDVMASQRVTGEVGEDIFSLVDRLSVEIKKDLSLPPAAMEELDPHVADVTTHSAEAYRYYLEGIDYHSKLYRAEAVAAFEKALEYDSTFAMVYYYLAVLKDRRYLAKAVEHYDRASRRDKYFIRAREAAFSGNLTLTVQVLQEAIEQYPEEKVALYLLGSYCSSLGRLNEAVEYLNRAIQLDPNYKTPYNRLAYVYESMGEFEKALASIDRYIELAPDEANPYDTRGEICARNGLLEEAIVSYEKSLSIRPDFTSSLMYLGYMYVYHGDYERGDSCLRALAETDDVVIRSAARLYLAYVPQYQGHLERTLEVLNESIAADRADSATADLDLKNLMKAQIHSELGNFDLARIELDSSIQFRQQSAVYRPRPRREDDVRLLATIGDLERAQVLADSLLNDIRRFEAAYDSYWFAQACIESAKGNLDSAVVLFERAAEGSPHFLRHYHLAMTYYGLERYDRAIEEFELIQKRYDSPRVFYGIASVKSHYYLGRCYEQVGRTDDTAEQYEELLRIWVAPDPPQPLVEEARERLELLRSGA